MAVINGKMIDTVKVDKDTLFTNKAIISIVRKSGHVYEKNSDDKFFDSGLIFETNNQNGFIVLENNISLSTAVDGSASLIDLKYTGADEFEGKLLTDTFKNVWKLNHVANSTGIVKSYGIKSDGKLTIGDVGSKNYSILEVKVSNNLAIEDDLQSQTFGTAYSSAKNLEFLGEVAGKITVNVNNKNYQANATGFEGSSIFMQDKISADIVISSTGIHATNSAAFVTTDKTTGKLEINGELASKITVTATSLGDDATANGFRAADTLVIEKFSKELIVKSTGHFYASSYGFFANGDITFRQDLLGKITITAVANIVDAEAYAFYGNNIYMQGIQKDIVVKSTGYAYAKGYAFFAENELNFADDINGKITVDVIAKDMSIDDSAVLFAKGDIKLQSINKDLKLTVNGFMGASGYLISSESGNVNIAGDINANLTLTGKSVPDDVHLVGIKGVDISLNRITKNIIINAAGLDAVEAIMINSTSTTLNKDLTGKFNITASNNGGIFEASAKGIDSVVLNIAKYCANVGTWTITAKSTKGTTNAKAWSLTTLNINKQIFGKMSVSSNQGEATGIEFDTINNSYGVSGEIPKLSINMDVKGKLNSYGYVINNEAKFILTDCKITVKATDKNSQGYVIYGSVHDQFVILDKGTILIGDIDLSGVNDNDTLIFKSGSSFTGNISNVENLEFHVTTGSNQKQPFIKSTDLSSLSKSDVTFEINKGISGSFSLIKGGANSITADMFKSFTFKVGGEVCQLTDGVYSNELYTYRLYTDKNSSTLLLSITPNLKS